MPSYSTQKERQRAYHLIEAMVIGTSSLLGAIWGLVPGWIWSQFLKSSSVRGLLGGALIGTVLGVLVGGVQVRQANRHRDYKLASFISGKLLFSFSFFMGALGLGLLLVRIILFR